MSATATEAILGFLQYQRARHNGPDLLDRYLRYGCDMETQVNVAAGKGEPVPGKRSTFTDGIDEWSSFRIPKDAMKNPHFKDFSLRWPFPTHVDAIGSTGWDWQSRRSRWVGFDFDSIIGHAAGVGVSDDQLARVEQAVREVPWIEVRKSTGGAGLHLYVMFEEEGLPCDNHDEHAAIARCILGLMSAEANFDLASQIDACGGNMWIWNRKSTSLNEGLTLIKPAEHAFRTDELPVNWREHLAVVKKTSAKVQLSAVADGVRDVFEQLTSAHRQVDLDVRHKAIMDALGRIATTVWVSDHHLLQTHTAALARLHAEPTLLDQAVLERIEGVFQTNSKGSDINSPNCFAFPLDNGSWRVYRFGQGTNEAPTWEQDGRGWTTCSYNAAPTLKVAARSLGAKETKSGGFEIATVEKAAEVGQLLGLPEFTVDEKLKGRKALVSKTKDGRLAIEVRKEKEDGDDLGNWNSSDKKGAWTQVFDVQAQPTKLEVEDYDNKIRCLESITGESSGWAAIKDHDGEWTRKNSGSIKMILQDLGHAKPEAECIMGRCERRPWKMVCMPFTCEYPGNRQWNHRAPQLAFKPADRNDDPDSRHPHWDMVLNHLGGDLTQYLKDLDWAIEAGVRTGADYLRAWYASILREPYEPLPYLFFWGPENTGKSTIHEAFEVLVTDGVVKADRALTSQSDFNGELLGAVLCVVEEKDISKTAGAQNKIKEAVTALRLSIRKMRQDSYMAPNLTHWIQCANTLEACPVFEGDTRIVVIYVDKYHGVDIPKRVLMSKLKEEAPEFLRTLLDMQLPARSGRLRIPVVLTQHKALAETFLQTPLEQFIQENVTEMPGSLLPFMDFYDRFYEWLPAQEKVLWSKIKVSKKLPIRYQSGFYTANKTFLTNAAWAGDADARPHENDPTPWMVTLNGRKIARVVQ